MLSFAIEGFIAPHLRYHAMLGILETVSVAEGSADLHAELMAARRPQDWNFFRGLAARGEDGRNSLAIGHSMVAFAILPAIMLPLGLAIGHGSRRFSGSARRLTACAMAAATTILVYGAQIGAWWVALSTEIWTGKIIYFGFLTVPLVIFLTLAWSGTAWPPSTEPDSPRPSGAVP
jgi:hypothetical protein